MSIINVNGRPYTTAAQDLVLEELKKEFTRRIGEAVTHAMQVSRDGGLRIDLRPAHELLEQAYYMGRNDAS